MEEREKEKEEKERQEEEREEEVEEEGHPSSTQPCWLPAGAGRGLSLGSLAARCCCRSKGSRSKALHHSDASCWCGAVPRSQEVSFGVKSWRKKTATKNSNKS